VNRLQTLKQFAEEEPNDPFNQYALALEYLKTDTAQAQRIFQMLLEKHPSYLPTYYPYAQLLVEKKEVGLAEHVYQKGIAVARSANDLKTMREIQAAYDDWKYET
jgi:Tfp pilus assembly protein PilF